MSRRSPLLLWLFRVLLVAAAALTLAGVVGISVRAGRLLPSWRGTEFAPLGLYGAAALVLGALVFFLLRRHARIAGAVLLVAFAAVGAGVVAVLAAAYVVASAAALGDLLVGRIPALAKRPLLAFCTAAATGLGLLAAVMGVLAHFPVNRWWVWLVLLAVPLAADRRRALSFVRRLWAWLKDGRGETAWAYWAGWLVLSILGLHLVRVVQPETGYDAVAMHLFVADYVAMHARWGFDFQHFAWALWPMAADWLSSVAWLLGGELAARLLNFAALLLILGMLAAVVDGVVRRPYGRLAAALFASASLVFGLTQVTMTELVFAAFTLAAFVTIVVLRDDRSNWRVAAAGVLLGACLLSKASAILTVAPLAVLLVVLLIRQRGLLKGAAFSAAAAAVCVVVGASAYVYAYVRTGNPVFPLYNAVFRSAFAAASTAQDPRWVGHFSWLLPYRMTFESAGYTEGFDGALGFQYVLLFPAALVAAIAARSRTLLLAALVALVAAVLVAANIQYLRYLFPALSVLMVACAGVFLRLDGQKRLERRAVQLLAVFVVGLNLLFLPAGAFFWNGFPLSGVVSGAARRDLLAVYAPERLLNDVVNARAGTRATVAYLGLPSGIGLEGQVRYANQYDPDFQAALDAAATPEQALAAFRTQGVTYVIVDQDSPDRPAVAEALRRSATRVRTIGGATLYRLDTPGT